MLRVAKTTERNFMPAATAFEIRVLVMKSPLNFECSPRVVHWHIAKYARIAVRRYSMINLRCFCVIEIRIENLEQILLYQYVVFDF